MFDAFVRPKLGLKYYVRIDVWCQMQTKFFIRYKTRIDATKQNTQNYALMWCTFGSEIERESERMAEQRIKYHKMEFIQTL